MKTWKQKLSQIHKNRCALTYGQVDITHQVSSKSHNGKVDFFRGIRAESKFLKSFWTQYVKFWTLSKMLRCFSYLLCEISLQNEFITLNLSKFGAFFDNLALDTNFWTMSKMLWLCSYLVWWILFMSWFYKQNMSTIGAFLTAPKIVDVKCEILDIVKNALIFLIFVVWNQLTKWIHHVEFEQIWSFFDNLELDTNFWTMSKMLRLCSYLVCWIIFISWFYKQNMSTIGAFLTTPKILDLNKTFGRKSRIWKTIFS